MTKTDRYFKPKISLIFLLLCIYRLINTWIIRTQFDADEYWQTLEPAYCLAFGSSDLHQSNFSEGDITSYGCALTWEWTRRWTPYDETLDTNVLTTFLLQAIHGPVRSYVSIMPSYGYYLACQAFFAWAQKSPIESLKNFVHQNASYIISKGPAFLHAITVAAPIDLSVWLIALQLEDLDGAINRDKSMSWSFWALLLSITSWFQGYALIRTYANCFETVCLVAGIVLLGPELFGQSAEHAIIQHRSNAKLAFILGGLSACVRFTSLAAWVPLGIIVTIRNGMSQNCKQAKQKQRKATKSKHYDFKAMYQTLFGLCGLYGALGVGLGCFIDRLMYGFWAVPFLGNFHFNIWLGLGSLYGTHPFLWYIYAGIPAICGSILPAFMRELYILNTSKTSGGSTEARMTILGIVITYTILHSFSEHKEFRFLLPILPLIILLAGHAMAEFFDAARDTCLKNLKNVTLIGVALLNFPHLLYLGTIHQRGPIAVNKYLTDTIVTAMQRMEHINIHYLMGCHSAPLYSHLHVPNVSIHAWYLDCSPDCRSRRDELCESDAFLVDPMTFVSDTYGDGSYEGSEDQEENYRVIPTFVAVMQNEASKIDDKLIRLGMSHVASIRHSIKSLAWHQTNKKVCRNDFDPHLTNHGTTTVLSLVDINYEHVEVYQYK